METVVLGEIRQTSFLFYVGIKGKKILEVVEAEKGEGREAQEVN